MVDRAAGVPVARDILDALCLIPAHDMKAIPAPTMPHGRRSSRGRSAAVTLILIALSACRTATPPPVTQPVVAQIEPVTAPVPARPLHIALALGGGAARGFAHIGVIKALEARGIYPDIIVGTSAGALVGSLYAGGYNGLELNRIALSMDESVLSDWTLSSRGLFKGEGLQSYVNHQVKDRPIEKLDKKFVATATDLHSGQLVVFDRGNTGQAVRASASVPGVFQPTKIGDHEYVDGGLVSPVPVKVARRLGADIVIAVDISSRPIGADTSGLFTELLQTFSIMGQTIASYEEKDADILLRPELPNVSGSDFASRNASVLAGEEAVAQQAARIKDVIAAKERQINGKGGE
jgi:NTE family protein